MHSAWYVGEPSQNCVSHFCLQVVLTVTIACKSLFLEISLFMGLSIESQAAR